MHPFDSITFSRDFIDDVDNLIKMFNDVSKNKLFVDSLSKPQNPKRILIRCDSDWYETKTFDCFEIDVLGEHYPKWFLKLNIASIAQWIVSHFEARIFKQFSKKLHNELQRGVAHEVSDPAPQEIREDLERPHR